MERGNEITLTFTIEETNTLLEALGHMPFMRVYRIIEKIHLQAGTQAPGAIPPASKHE